MGLTNRDIVALCGAHTIGRAFKNRSGVCPNTSGDQGATEHTRKENCFLFSTQGCLSGGKSWTKNWLVFDNSYFKRYLDPDNENLLWLVSRVCNF